MDAFRESTRVELVVVQRNDIGYDDGRTDPTLPTESPMIIKHADDKSTDIDTLQSLLAHPSATPEVRKRIEQEVRNIKAGVRGESEATQEMKVRYGESVTGRSSMIYASSSVIWLLRLITLSSIVGWTYGCARASIFPKGSRSITMANSLPFSTTNPMAFRPQSSKTNGTS